MSDTLKVSGKNFPDPVDPIDRVCFTIEIPDSAEYRAALMGQIGWLADWRCWKHNYSDFTDPPPELREIAGLFAEAISTSSFEECGVMSCDDIADCIETDAGVQAALNDRINQHYQPTNPNSPMPGILTAQNLVPDTGCNLSELWGSIDNLIENMNINNQDMQQLIESASNLGERVALLIQGIPGVGILPIDEVIDYAQTLLTDDVFEAYLAADTTEYRHEVKCSLFCLAMDNACILSLDDVGTYFSERLTTFWADTFQDVLLFLAAGVWTGSEINDTFYYIQCQALAKSNNFFGMLGLPNFQVYMATGVASSDYLLLCDECFPDAWEYIIDLTAGNPAYGNILRGYDDMGLGIRGAGGGGYEGVYDYFVVDPFDCVTITLYRELEITQLDGSQGDLLFGDLSLSHFLGIGTYTDPDEFEVNITIDRFDVIVQSSQSSQTGTSLLTSIRVRGTGTMPSQFV